MTALDPSVYRDLVRRAIAEDLGVGDITTEAIVSGDVQARGVLLAKSPCVLAGLDIAREVFRDRANVEVDTFDGLLVDYARRRQAGVIVRGLRAVSDFEYEMQMALMNRRLNPEVETVFMMPAEQYSYISSRLIKEVFALGGRVHGLVPDSVEERLRQKVTEPSHKDAGKQRPGARR